MVRDGRRLVVFLHGLMETELSWHMGAGPDGETTATRLRRDLGCTPVEARYKSGRHISDNGLSLADLLSELVTRWPAEVESIALVGHSMGGLVARLLRRRSAGIRDLRQGSLVDADWRDCHPDALRAVACQEVPLLEGATHCFVAATVTRSGRDPVGRLLGDCLVLQTSAWGRSRTCRITFDEEYGAHVGGTHHLALLNHPRVYERMLRWLEG